MQKNMWINQRRKYVLFIGAVLMLMFMPEPKVLSAQTDSLIPIPTQKPTLISQNAHDRIQYSLFDLRKANTRSTKPTTTISVPALSLLPKSKPDSLNGSSLKINAALSRPKAAKSYRSASKRSGAQAGAVKALQSRIKTLLRNDRITIAERTLNDNSAKLGLDTVEHDLMQGQIAAAALYHGDVSRGYTLASAAATRSGLHAPKAGWIAGLGAWINKDYDSAARYFEITARSPYVSHWQAAAGSYWAARAHREMGNTRAAKGWLEHAAKYQDTFYGLIAMRTLDNAFVLTPALKQSHPRPVWGTRTNYGIDPALVHAIALQESRFNPNAKSPSGAKGLMQIMPATARHVAENINIDLGDDLQNLYMPQTNLKVGQAYLAELLSGDNVKGDIMSLLIAYNGGPGNLSRWKKNWNDIDDSLLFVELIPLNETRKYVEKVLANYWIYRMRDNKATPTLNGLAFTNKVEYADHSGHILRVADRR